MHTKMEFAAKLACAAALLAIALTMAITIPALTSCSGYKPSAERSTTGTQPASIRAVEDQRGRYFERDTAECELLIIARCGLAIQRAPVSDIDEQQQPPVDVPTRAELRAVTSGGEQQTVPLPLEHTDVKARVSAFVATVDVLQKYHNPYGEKIEAVYVFPLPELASVTDFLMIIGDRQIRGIIREREEAQQIYEEAKRQGYVASLLTQERPNIFTQKVANIEPGKKIDINVRYFYALPYRDGEYEFVLPMVVGPRFNPPGSSTGVGAVAAGERGASGQRTEVQYLPPDKRSAHDISVQVDVDAGVSVEKVYSHSHAIQTTRHDASRFSVSLSPNDTIPNKDLVLRYKVAGAQTKIGAMVQRSEKGNFFALVLQPPEDMKNLPRMPREMVFVLDCSGSMKGRPLDKAKDAMRRCLRKLDENDTFQIVRFSDSASQLGREPVQATPENVRKGIAYLDGLESEGGTMMIRGIEAALDFPHDEHRLRIVSFMTDGYIGNEMEILAAIKRRLGPARIFSFGIGTSV
ncbi:MAG: VIT domain-containing protein, partial [Planctomycetota bacterium]|nr:VIT domain-containing protein [Planctomycetota bacterium]